MTPQHHAQFGSLEVAASPLPSQAKLTNDLRDAERTWQWFASADTAPGGNPWADQRDAAKARYLSIKAQIAAFSQVAA